MPGSCRGQVPTQHSMPRAKLSFEKQPPCQLPERQRHRRCSHIPRLIRQLRGQSCGQGPGPAHTQGQDREHHNGIGSNQQPRAQTAVAQWLSLEKWESFVGGVVSLYRQQRSFLLSMSISGVTSGMELGAALWKGGQKGTS